MGKVINWKLAILLALASLWSSPGDSQRVEMPKYKEVIKGQMVVLDAWYTPTSNIEKNTVSWTFMSNNSKQIITYTLREIGLGSPEFRKRVGFLVSMPSTNISIYINNTQESDSGLYLCNVIVPGAPGLSGELKLNVKVPPSTPKCSMTGDPVLSGNVTLSCKSDSGKPVPQYKWTKAAPISEIFFSPMQNEMQGTLRLSNLTKSMSGKYVCKASNTAGSESCHINLEVSTPNNAWVIAVATVGSVVGLMALILFLIFVLRRNGDTEEETANDIKEDAQAPKRVSWAKSATGSDIISKNGTLSSIATSNPPLVPNHASSKHRQYPHGMSDSASVLTASGSTAPYRPHQGEPNPLHGLPGYNANRTPAHSQHLNHHHQHHHHHHPWASPSSDSSSTTHRTEGAQPQPPRATAMPVSSPTLPSMGTMPIKVPVVVPSQNHAGSLV